MRGIILTASVLLVLVISTFAQVLEREYPTGLAFAPPGDLQKVPLGTIPLTGLLPPSIDLSSHFPEPGNQGKQGSCVGWAVGYALKSYQERVERNWQWDDDSLFSPSYVYNHSKVSNDCDRGAHFTSALEFVKSSGAASRSVFEYDDASCHRLASEAERQGALRFRIADYARVEPSDEFEMKAQLAGGKPVLIGMAVDRAFMNIGRSIYQGLMGPARGGHAMVVVGYDDGLGAYKVINSWGSDWSFNGFGWIGYSVFAQHQRIVREAYVVTDAQELPTPSPPPVPAAATTRTKEHTLLVIYRRPISLGIRSDTRVTGDHHCSVNCTGEPTRTAYSLTLSATGDRLLRNPRLTCEGEACPWSSIGYVRVQDLGRRVEAGWSVWGRPTLWRLEAEEYEVQDYKQEMRKASAGTTIQVTAANGDAAPVVAITRNSRQLRVSQYLNDPASNVFYVGREERGGEPIYTFRIQPD